MILPPTLVLLAGLPEQHEFSGKMQGVGLQSTGCVAGPLKKSSVILKVPNYL
jgi:hypothetical protein